MKPRQELNFEILRQLKHYLTMNPDIRFGQALVNLDVLEPKEGCLNEYYDPFYEEPQDTLKRMKASK